MPSYHFRAPDYSLRQLQYAVAVAETGGFGAAAALCGVSQPSLSAQVAKLESVLGAELFVRSRKGVHPSAAGETLLPKFREALAAAAAVNTAAATLEDPYAVPVRIAVIPTVAPYLLPAVTKALAGQAGPTVHWLELQTAFAEEAVAFGKADAMLIADPPDDSELEVIELGWDPFVIVAPPDAALPEEVPLDWLHEQRVLLLEQGHCLRDQALSLCRLPSAQRSPIRATSLGTMVQMIAAGLGVSVLPAMAVASERVHASIQIRPFADVSVGRTLTFATVKGHPLAPVLREVATALRDALEPA